MGRYNFAPQNVHKHATQLLHANRLPAAPPWYKIIQDVPPSTRLVRQPMQRAQKPGAKPARKKSRLFQPLSLRFEEDALRWDYFNDHPWELARPRVVLEDDGRDHEKWDWSLPLDYTLRRPPVGDPETAEWDANMKTQSARPINGESVVLRQQYLLNHTSLTPAAAYDKARKELYRQRHAKEVEARVAREEALAVGAYFGKGPLEVGMELEDKQYENWREWAEAEVVRVKALQGSAYSGTEDEAAVAEIEDPLQEELQEVSSAIPAAKAGQTALGGAAFVP
ncbi:37S ribosomal S25, mitochondrial [Lecanosticta acicola]|uniref:Small ribosomal subunit protein mS23 n=1 Tax=Lecanosticta acicola TaxID=111012 RepID=A0AAI8Z7I4_9PEZI|nr:37S ribosomal S25, mitochondrial [Lecanosticta acicola]